MHGLLVTSNWRYIPHSSGGNNAQANNIVSGIFLATGQDIAQAGTSSMALVTMECVDQGDLYVSLTMPCIEVCVKLSHHNSLLPP